MSDTERKVGVTERLLAAIVDIQHHITHGAEPLGCAACPRWDELQSAAVAIVDEAERLRGETQRAVEAEREACASLFDGPVWAYDYREIAARIRARRGESR
jgi:hypothetical protein